MKRIVLSFTICFLFLIPVQILAYSNLLPNPSFEVEGSDLGPLKWSKWSSTTTNAIWTWEENVSHTGDRSMSISNITSQEVAVISDGVLVSPGSQYTISAWVKAENIGEGTVFLVANFWAGSTLLEERQFIKHTELPDGHWLHLNDNFIVPEGTTAVSVGVRIKPPINQNAIVYIDDMALYNVPDNSFWLKTSNREKKLVKEDAFGGYLYHLDNTGNFAYLMYPLPKLLPAGNYQYKVRFFGDPSKQGGQKLRLVSSENIETEIGDVIRAKDGAFHILEGTVESPNDIKAILVKKLGTSQNTNPIDWIWFGSEDAIFSEEQFVIASPPGDLTAVHDGPLIAKLEWTPPPSGSGIGVYQVFRGIEPDFPVNESTLVANTDECSFSEQMDPSNPVYYYKVIAWNGIYSAFSSPVAATSIVSDNVPPGEPQNLTGSVAVSGIVKLSWTPPNASPHDGEKAAGYNVYRAVGEPSFGSTPIITIEADTPGFTNDPTETMIWKDLDVTPGTNYYYAVSAFDLVGNESQLVKLEEPMEPTSDINPPYPPTGADIDLEVIRGAVTFNWITPEPHEDDEDLAEKFIIYRAYTNNPIDDWQSEGGARYIIEEETPGAGLARSYIDNTVIPGETYYYALVSVDKAGNESTAIVWQEVIPLAPYAAELQFPKEEMAVVDGNFIFSWIAPQEYAGDSVEVYFVQMARDEEFSEDFIESDPLEETSYQNTETLAAGTWYWRVKTVYASGVISYSEPESFQNIVNGDDGLKVAIFEVEPKIFNPRNTELLIYYTLKDDSHVTIRLFNMHGKLVKTFKEKEWEEARNENGNLQYHQIYWDGKTNQEAIAMRGIYLVQIEILTPGARPTTMIKRFQIAH